MAAAAGRVGIWELDLETGRFHIDPWLKLRLGYREDEIPNDRREWSRRMHDEDRALMASAVRACVEGRSGAVEAEHRMICRDGSTCRLHARGTAIKAPDGRVARVVGTCVDITERKLAEFEGGRFQSELEERVRGRTADLQASLGELESFSYSVSHDLRTPLRAINGYSHLLLAKHAAALDSEGHTYLKRICAATERMGELIDSLLALSRISLAETRAQTVDLGRIAEGVIAGLREQQAGRKLAVLIRPDLTAEGGPDLLRVLPENLLGNAWKFTGRDGSVGPKSSSAAPRASAASRSSFATTVRASIPPAPTSCSGLSGDCMRRTNSPSAASASPRSSACGAPRGSPVGRVGGRTLRDLLFHAVRPRAGRGRAGQTNLTSSAATCSTRARSRSPRSTRLTPAGVPVKTRSPALSAT